jgi:hypothetical protein
MPPREAREGVLTAQEVSPTASTRGSEVQFPASGVQSYRVMIQTAMGGVSFLDVDASTGDEAAEKALSQAPGSKVTNIAPTPQKRGE